MTSPPLTEKQKNTGTKLSPPLFAVRRAPSSRKRKEIRKDDYKDKNKKNTKKPGFNMVFILSDKKKNEKPKNRIRCRCPPPQKPPHIHPWSTSRVTRTRCVC